jgi:glycosyltransferase involved in cell wall biosynthesis
VQDITRNSTDSADSHPLAKTLARPLGEEDSNRQPIRVGIEALAWNQKTGYGRYCRELISALLRIPSRYCFTLLMEADAIGPAGAEVIRFDPPRASAPVRTLPRLLSLTRTIARAGMDLWFFPSPLNFVPVIARATVIVAVHDTIPWRYPKSIFPSYAQRVAWNIKLRLAAQQSSRLITVSDHARKSVARHFRLSEDAITIVGEAPAAVFRPLADCGALAAISERLAVPPLARMIVYHGAFAPHKNLRALARVFLRLYREPRFSDVYLVMVGSQSGPNRVEFQALQTICHGLDRVKFPGALADHDLALALNRATLAVLPSLEEGFGLTGLEAVACGTPLIATRSSALPDVLGDAAVYFEPQDEDTLYAHLAALLADSSRRHALRERGLKRIASLSWESGAMRLMEVFDSVLARPGRVRGFQARAR